MHVANAPPEADAVEELQDLDRALASQTRAIASAAAGARIGSASSSRSAGPALRSHRRSWDFRSWVRPIRLSIDAIDQRLETAAKTLGGSRL
jgi:hypothetical protein